MEYNLNKTVTNIGNQLLVQSLQDNQNINFTDIIITDTELRADKNLAEMTIDDFQNARKYPISNFKKGKNSVQPEAQLTNDGLTSDYPIAAVGLLAKTSESNSVLYAVTQNSSGSPALLPKYSNTNYFITYDMAIMVTNADHFDATVTFAGYVDQSSFNEEINNIKSNFQNYVTNDQLKASLAGIDLSSATAKANEYTDDQLKDYTNNESLEHLLAGKQDKGDYVTSEQLDGKDYATNTSVNGVNNRIDNLGIKVLDGKLYYDNLPVITAQAPSGVSVSLDRATDGIQATINVDDNGGLSNIYYQLFYKKSDDAEWQFIDHPERTSTITVPMDGSTYDVKAKAGNSAGLSNESSEFSIVNSGIISGRFWVDNPSSYNISNFNTQFDLRFNSYKVFFSQMYSGKTLNSSDENVIQNIINFNSFPNENIKYSYIVKSNVKEIEVGDGNYSIAANSNGDYHAYVMAVGLNDDGSLTQCRTTLQEL